MEAFRIAAPLEKVMRIQYVQRDVGGGAGLSRVQ